MVQLSCQVPLGKEIVDLNKVLIWLKKRLVFVLFKI